MELKGVHVARPRSPLSVRILLNAKIPLKRQG